MASIVGTWRKKDRSLVECRPDGSIVAEGQIVAQWKPWPQKGTPHLHLVRFSSSMANYKGNVGHYQRRLTLEHPGNGAKTVLERVDDGPTRNPDVPDEQAALRMEDKDITAQLTDLQIRLPKVQAEAADAWQQHWAARAIGRISTHNLRAKGLEATAESMARSIRSLEERQGEVRGLMGARPPLGGK